MCGIAGFTNFRKKLSTDDLKSTLKPMTQCIQHRGPDAGDIWINQNSQIILGHRRLSIIDLSPTGAQPMTSQNGRYTVVYNGEIYNYPELKKDLSDKNIEVDGTSDTRVLLEYIDTFGLQNTLPKLNGMFAFALWDSKEHQLILARDRIGQKPLYYSVIKDEIIFSSELKALEKHPDFNGQINRQSVSKFLRFGYVPEPETIYTNVYKLPPAHFIIFDKNTKNPIPQCFWSYEQEHIFENSAIYANTNTAITTLKDTLRDAVKRCMLSDVPLGAFLSGGTDSSLITALMQEQSTNTVRTFTMGFEDPKFDESGYARDIAKHLGTDHTEMIVSGNDVLDVVPKIKDIYDEPFADMSQIPTYLLCKLTAQNLKVALSGDAADELFAGYVRYPIMQKLNLIFRYAPLALRKTLSTLNHLPTPQKIKRLGYILSANNKYEGYERLFTHYPWTSDLIIDGGDVEFSFPTYAKELDDLSALQHFDIAHYLPGDIFTKVDRASMAVSLETRTPFLDNNVMAFARHMPARLKQNDRTGKWILKQILKDYIPPNLTERPKKGFDLPLAQFLREDLKDWASDILSIKNNDLLNEQKIDRIWRAHQNNRANYHQLIWNIIILKQWLNK